MRVAITTLGCKVNQYDSAVFERMFDERGWHRVDFSQPADAYVVNTCTVTDRADAEARRLARRARRANPEARVIMTGCYAQVDPAAVAALGEVDHVVGLGRLADLLAAVEGDLGERVAVSDLRKAREVATFGIRSFPGRSRAFVKIQEGCDLFCTFCIIPMARGPSRSVEPHRVADEIERLAAAGHREVVLTGVHLGGYGRDLPQPTSLPELLALIAERRPSARVRLSSIDPPEVTAELVSIVARGEIFCDHFHVPLQAGDDRTLARMRRRYTTAEAAEAFVRIRRLIPDASIGTDLITGFPGETEEEFAETCRFVERLKPSYLHVFPYSSRRSTSAAKRWKPIEPRIVHERARHMRAIDRRLRRAYEERFVGRTLEVLLEGESGDDNRVVGHARNYLKVAVANAGDRRIVRTRVSGRRGNRLLGTAL